MNVALLLNTITTIAVVGGVVFGAWQIRQAARARTTQISLHLIEMLNSQDMIAGLHVLIGVPAGLDWDELEALLGESWPRVFMVINALDGLGILAFRKGVDLQTTDDYFHHAVDEVWTKCGSAILARRKAPGRESAFQYLEWLAKAQAKYRANAERNNPRAYPNGNTRQN